MTSFTHQILKSFLAPTHRLLLARNAAIVETPWKRKYLRRFGFEERLFKRPDTLPRIKEGHKYEKLGMSRLREYKPYKEWSDKKKYFGQNDYIDILGDGSIHPIKLLSNVPVWLRGFKGNEFQMLLLKQRHFSFWRWSQPTKWKHLNKRIMFLYRYLNRNTKTYK